MFPCSGIQEVLALFSSVRLDEMDGMMLMNRVDTKYVLPVNKIPDLLIRMDGSYKTLEINNSRLFSYNTTYLDTRDYLFFNQHVTGKLERNKVRYRNYETTGSTFLEVKKKTNKNRTVKWRIGKVPVTGNECDCEALEFIKEYVHEKNLALKPALLNSFKRVTLTNTVTNERITIDFDLSFTDPDHKYIELPFIAIIEQKREGYSRVSPVTRILKEYSARPTGFSKYCIGTALLKNIPRKNVLKPKLMMINKIENELNRFVYA